MQGVGKHASNLSCCRIYPEVSAQLEGCWVCSYRHAVVISSQCINAYLLLPILACLCLHDPTLACPCRTHTPTSSAYPYSNHCVNTHPDTLIMTGGSAPWTPTAYPCLLSCAFSNGLLAFRFFHLCSHFTCMPRYPGDDRRQEPQWPMDPHRLLLLA
jgi:hypothetical protein